MSGRVAPAGEHGPHLLGRGHGKCRDVQAHERVVPVAVKLERRFVDGQWRKRFDVVHEQRQRAHLDSSPAASANTAKGWFCPPIQPRSDSTKKSPSGPRRVAPFA